MIEYNGILLDYYGDTLNKLIVKRALTDIESLKDRKGTTSTAFDLPRTAVNEKAFGFITTDGTITNSSGSALIYIDNNVYSQGKMYVVGYDDAVIKCNYFGSDLDFIFTISKLSLKEIIEEYPSYANAFNYYNDYFFEDAMISLYGSDVHYCINAPNVIATTFITGAVVPTPANFGFFFKIKDMVNRIVTMNGYNLVSNFFNSDFADAQFYSTHDGKHKSTTFLNAKTTVVTTLSEKIEVGNIALGDFIKTGDAYWNYRALEGFNFDCNVNLIQDAKVKETYLTIYIRNPLDEIIYVSASQKLQEGDNAISLKNTQNFIGGFYVNYLVTSVLKTGFTAPISSTILVTNGVFSHTNIVEDDVLRLRNYISDITQLDFIKSVLLRYNLILDIQGQDIYIDSQQTLTAPTNGEVIESINQLDAVDISHLVKDMTDVDIDIPSIGYISLEQKFTNNATVEERSIGNISYGSELYDIENTSKEIEEYTDEFNSVYDFYTDSLLSGIIDISALGADFAEPIESWENVICTAWGYFGFVHGTRDYFNEIPVPWIDISSGTYTYPPPEMYIMDFAQNRYKTLYNGFFVDTLSKKKNNKVKQIEIYDTLGTLMNFRTNYIINDQVYKLLSFEYDIIAKLVIAKIILK